MDKSKKAYCAPELTVYGDVEAITSSKTYVTSDDWIGKTVDFLTPKDNQRVLGWQS